MNAKELIIAIRSAFDRKGTEEAQRQLDATGKKADEAGKKTEAGGIGAAKGFSALGQAAVASGGSVQGLASALGNMAAQVPALSAAAGPIGLAIAAAMAWVRAIQAAADAQDAMDKRLSETAVGNVEASLRNLSAAYLDLKDSISSAADEVTRLYEAESAKDDAAKKADLARLSLDRARQLAALSPDDTVGRRRLDVSVAERRAEIEEAAERRKAERDHASLRAQAFSLEALKAAAEEQFRAASSKAPVLTREFDHARSRADASAGRWYNWNDDMRAAARTRVQPELDRITESLAKVADEMKKAQADRAKAEQGLVSLVNRYEVMRIESGTRDVTTSERGYLQADERRKLGLEQAEANLARFRGGIGTIVEAARRNYDVRQREADIIDASGFRRFGAQSATYRDALRIDRERDRDAGEAKRLVQAAEALESSVKGMDPERLTRVFESLRRQQENLERAVRNMESRAARPGSGG